MKVEGCIEICKFGKKTLVIISRSKTIDEK